MTGNGYTDIRYEIDDGVAIITIDRPERMNAFRGRTVDELIAAFRAAWADSTVAAVVLTGAGDRAFCAGGDQKQRAETGDYGPTESGLFEIERLHRLIRAIPKPVIAAVNGFAIGGGHVLHVLCDLTVASETARFGQIGPRVGSFDGGFGTVYLARVVGEKRARADLVPARPVRRRDGRTLGARQRRRAPGPGRAHRRRLGEEDRRLLADGDPLPQALVQRRHRPHRRHPKPRLRRTRPVLEDG